MQVEVRLHFTLRRKRLSPDKPSFIVILKENATVGELLAHLEIEATEGLIILVNGRPKSSESKLTEGCTVTVFEAVEGG